MLYVSNTIPSTGNTVVNHTDKILHSSREKQAINGLKYRYLRGKYIYNINRTIFNSDKLEENNVYRM